MVLSAAFPFDSHDVQTWHLCSRLLPHALAATAHAEARAGAPETTQHILNEIGRYLHGRAEFAEAKAQYERALSLAEKAFGASHPKVAAIVNNLGRVLHDMGDLEGAKERYERTLEIVRKVLGENHTYTITVRKNLELLATG